MPSLDLLSLSELELDRVLELVAALASSEPGREATRQLAPSVELQAVRARLDETVAMLDWLHRHGSLELGSLLPLEAQLERLGREPEPFGPRELAGLFSLVATLERLRRTFQPAPGSTLAEKSDTLPDLQDLHRLGRQLFDDEGRFREDASPELVRIRGQLGQRRRDLDRRAREILRNHADVFQDDTVVVRGERFCLPLRSDSRGRLPSIVHDRSQTGQTLFVEPLEMVELNNDLTELRTDESHEIERLVRHAAQSLTARRDDLLAGFRVAVELDVIQARARFARLGDASCPRIMEDGGGIHLPGVRHPLLDERLARVRRDVFGEAEDRASRPVVPVEIEFDDQILLLTGPNAGGKTATLKAIGLAVAMTQTGLLVPSDAAPRLPLVRRIFCHIGDRQDLLSDLSTFSSAIARLAELVESATPGTLVLLDELGAATDPEEGGALAVALVEALRDRGATVIATTHLSILKQQVGGTEGAVVAAMEFDSASGRPTFRLQPGEVGRSYALALAARAGVPARILDRARQVLGDDWQRRERAEKELADARRVAETAAHQAEQARRGAEDAARELQEEKDRLAEERQRSRQKIQLALDGIKHRADAALGRALEDLGSQIRQAGLSRQQVRRQVDQVRQRVLDAAHDGVSLPEPEETSSQPPRLGDTVRLDGLPTTGVLREVKGRQAVVEVGGKTLRVPADRLSRAKSAPATSRGEIRLEAPESASAEAEINLVGKTVEEAVDLLDAYLDRALLAGRNEVRVIHGFGTGRLRRGIEAFLSDHPAVASTRLGESGEGGGGATIVRLDG